MCQQQTFAPSLTSTQPYPAELACVYHVEVAAPETGTATGDVARYATGHGKARVTPATSGDPELTIRRAAAEAKLRGLKDMVAELPQSRDDWKGQAECAKFALVARHFARGGSVSQGEGDASILRIPNFRGSACVKTWLPSAKSSSSIHELSVLLPKLRWHA